VPLYLGVHRYILAAALHQFLAGLEVLAFDRQLRGLVELLGPVAEAVAEPRRLGLERRQPELLPDTLAAAGRAREPFEVETVADHRDLPGGVAGRAYSSVFAGISIINRNSVSVRVHYPNAGSRNITLNSPPLPRGRC